MYSASLLQLQHLHYAYAPAAQAVCDVSLDIAPGAMYCLIGRSGCGKTSLLKLAAGLLQPQQGRVLWRGEPVMGPHPDMGFVFQRPSLLDWLSATDNVLLPLSLQRSVQAHDRDKAVQVLTRMGLGKHLQHKPSQLSGGQQSRVAIARALIGDPQILFMDEPFAALDAITREELQRDLLDLCAQQGTSMLFVTHDIAEAVYLGDHVAVMHQGQIEGRLSIDLPRPRHNAMRYGLDFNALCAQLRQTMDAGF
jgi:NitT/TauT family transport system ATP-binding protein